MRLNCGQRSHMAGGGAKRNAAPGGLPKSSWRTPRETDLPKAMTGSHVTGSGEAPIPARH